MEASIPFCDGLSLGQTLHVTKHPFKQGPLLVPDDIEPIKFRVNLTTAQFCVISSIEDVSIILQIPLAYVLKVEAGLINDAMVSACIKSVYDEDTICTIFRLSFLQHKQYLPQDISINLDALPLNSDGNQTKSTAEDISKDTEPDKSVSSATHWVKALELGNELIVICNISSHERDELSSTFDKLTENLGTPRGLLGSSEINGLEKFAKKMDKKLKKPHYNEKMSLQIEYCTYTDLQCAPANLTDMVNVMKEFLRMCEAWAYTYTDNLPSTFNKGLMALWRGNHMPHRKGILERLSRLGQRKQEKTSVKYYIAPSTSSDVDTVDDDRNKLFASKSYSVYHLRAIIQSFQKDDGMFNSSGMVQLSETCHSKLIRLHKVLRRNIKTIEKLQTFLTSDLLFSEDHMKEGKKLLTDSCVVQLTLHETIKGLNFITVPTYEQLNALVDSDSSQSIEQFIESVTSELPPGPDLDFLIIGKTGHGKSSTGNSILGLNKFQACASSRSVTTTCDVGWTRVNGRTLKVVDTPGIFDTRVDSDQSSIDAAILAISKIIAQCPNGFHALLLVIRFGQRMSKEERKAIGMLKSILGEDIIKTHCVCVITYGDNFKTEMKGQMTFKDWCKNQKGFLHDIFEECQYRCVLFDNKSEDSKLLRHQLIELVANVDGLSSNGTRYTNSLFEFAMNERQKAIEAEKAPEVDENVMRDIQLVLDRLEKTVQGSDEIETFQTDLINLRYAVGELKNQVNGKEGDIIEKLSNTINSLSETVQAKMDEMTEVPQCEALEGRQTKFTQKVKPHQENLMKTTEEIEPKRDKVNGEVSQGVKRKVKAEGGSCFPGMSWVISKDGSQKMMQDLNVRDEILVRKEDGRVAFEEVYMFGHHDEQTLADFLVFETDHHQVFASEDHLVYCLRNGLEVCLPARLVREDDELIIISGQKLMKQKILKISTERHTGLFAPFTFSGTVIVNGALMSCYVDALPPAKAHKLLKPIRKLYQISPLALEFINGSKRGTTVPSWAKLFLKWKKQL